MSELLQEYRQQASYRRGTVMGLTAAEAFMLIAFILLTLLVFWRVTADDEKERLHEENARLAVAVDGMHDPVALANALAFQKRFAKLDPEVMEERLDLMEDEKLRVLASEAQSLPLDGLLELRDLVRDGAFPGAKEKLALLEEVGLQPAEIAELRAMKATLVREQDVLKQYRAHGLTPEAIANARETLESLQRLGFQTADLVALEERLRQLLEAEKQSAKSKPHEWPPIINLSEAGGYFFESGSAELTAAFTSKLQGSIAAQIAQSLDQYDVDVIEVIGHTDEQPVSRKWSNWDDVITEVVDGNKPITSIVPADNAGLGMARALAVVKVLRSDKRLSGATILPMSGAQLILPGDKLTAGQAGDVEARRRIEIRIRRRNEG